MRVVLMGMPGAGKGTQAVRLRNALGQPQVSTGDILRQAVAGGSPLGRSVRGHLDAGELVPDALIEDLMVERLGRADAKAGFILDGFPRTGEQVAILDRILERLGAQLDAVLLIQAPAEEIVRRLTGRRICPRCDAVYHVDSQPPRAAGVCDLCASALVQRADDTEQVILERLDVYTRQTLPILNVYRERGLLREIDGSGDPQAVFDRLKVALGQA